MSELRKDAPPIETIQRVRSLLCRVGVLPMETRHRRVGPGIYSCRVRLGNDEFSELDIGTNGKGVSREYALASAYAEFAERLQNGVAPADHVRVPAAK